MEIAPLAILAARSKRAQRTRPATICPNLTPDDLTRPALAASSGRFRWVSVEAGPAAGPPGPGSHLDARGGKQTLFRLSGFLAGHGRGSAVAVEPRPLDARELGRDTCGPPPNVRARGLADDERSDPTRGSPKPLAH